VLTGLDDGCRHRPNLVVDFSGRSEQGFIEFNHVGWFLARGVFDGLSSDPSTLVQKDRTVVNVGARSQFEGPVFAVHPRNRFDVSAYFVGKDADGHTVRNFAEVQVEYLFVEVGVNKVVSQFEISSAVFL
jgi:hypothetical protein